MPQRGVVVYPGSEFPLPAHIATDSHYGCFFAILKDMKPRQETRKREIISTEKVKKELVSVYPWLQLRGERKAKEQSPRERSFLEDLRHYGALSNEDAAEEREKLREKIETAMREEPPMALLGVDLSGLDLRGINFSRVAFYVCDVHDTNFSEAKMEGTRWIFCDMRGNTLNGIEGDPLFMHCNMSDTLAEHTDFSSTTFLVQHFMMRVGNTPH